MSSKDQIALLGRLAAKTPLFRRADATAAGISGAALSRLFRTGKVDRVARGLYQLSGGVGHENPGLLEASLLVPKGVIALISALSFHGIGTHSPRAIWMQLPSNYPHPKIPWPPLRIVRSRLLAAFTLGVDTHIISGHRVRITDPDRTIVDCFKHRNLVTLELCIEALRERLRNRQHSLQAMNRYAKKMGVAKVMQPYIEALA